MTTDLILGTAGHIDHGKTSLIRALTGVDTDRLPEEQRRGITIELGFAELQLGDIRLGIVDVPGHERFVRNMLCGATGMDLVLLVVAADDSVKPQTREHLDILRLLDLSAGVIAVTKVDMVDQGWLELVREEIRELVAGTFLADAPMVFTSVVSGQGLDELRNELGKAAARAATMRPDHHTSRLFRMAIDRSFHVAGHGTVVTGSVSSGKCRVGDELTIEPGGMVVRVRGLHNHDRDVVEIQRGQRAAINLAGIHHDGIGRGQEIGSPGFLRSSKLLTVSLQAIPAAPRPLKDRCRVKLHVGTAEILSTVRLLDRDHLNPGETAPAQLFLSEPAATVWSQPFVIRCESPPATMGGGRVLDPQAERIRKLDAESSDMINRLASREPIERASAALYFAGFRNFHPDDLVWTAGIPAPRPILESLLQQGIIKEIQLTPTRMLRVHRQALVRLFRRVEAALKKLHEAHPLRMAHDRAMLVAGFRYLGEEALLDAAIAELVTAGRVRLTPQGGLSLAGSAPRLSNNEQKLLSQLVETIRNAGLQPPLVKEFQQLANRNHPLVPQLLALAAANGELVEIAADFYLHADVERQARKALAERFGESNEMTVSEIREVLNTSRKYAIPYCEYLDRIGLTERRGDMRSWKGDIP